MDVGLKIVTGDGRDKGCRTEDSSTEEVVLKRGVRDGREAKGNSTEKSC